MEAQVFFLDGDNLRYGEEVTLNCSILIEEEYYDGDMPFEKLRMAPPHLFVIDPAFPRLDRAGLGLLHVTFKELSMALGNRKFYLSVSVTAHDGQVLTALSPGLVVVRHRLQVRTVLDDPSQEVWFKDEGGKDNRIELEVSLVDGAGRLVRSRPIPLRLLLTYAGGEVVLNQDILQISPDCKLFVDSGTASLRVRINDISKNHQKRLFVVVVSPDCTDAPLLNDVSPCCTDPIEVRSKRAKRTREVQPMASVPHLHGKEALTR
jgi:hypothetical protein